MDGAAHAVSLGFLDVSGLPFGGARVEQDAQDVQDVQEVTLLSSGRRAWDLGIGGP